ncbi:M48 family metallopeptidase [Teredinibacter waterburyi]|uniref:M48 family metallopeptidase n=1 Tax=Teredinibacter waterburyi TaxID=1500538 RepID=UPI00165FE984|nr:M48 family metallopeptidase [Teredinibacter waterburyi]
MNFFQHQQSAKKRTTLLVLLLSLAVISLIALTVAAVAALLFFSDNSGLIQQPFDRSSLLAFLLDVAQSQLGYSIAAGVVATVLVASVYKWMQLNGGGSAVAVALGGYVLSHETASPAEKRLLNVVEEIAIASGNPVPLVYRINDQSINAFAAGLTRRDAVIGITRGCIELLNREELQGIIAHEFSHIHNGDMRLNMRLVAILHGILVIGLIGKLLLYSSPHRTYSSRKGKNGNSFALLGLAFIAIGYSGTFFGNLIKAAVSRQREFLADASAVQFTRNPNGIGNALRKIGGATTGSTISNGNAAQFSHMFFVEGVSHAFSPLATHPPLHQRIKRVLPGWNGSYIKNEPQQSKPSKAGSLGTNQSGNFNSSEQHSSGAGAHSVASGKLESLSQFVAVAALSLEPITPKHAAHASAAINEIPVNLRDAAHQTFSARALIYCLILDKANDVRELQLEQLRTIAHPATYKVVTALHKYVYQLPRRSAITLIEMSIPALKLMSAPQLQVFNRCLLTLIHADKKISLFEWCLHRIVTNNLNPVTLSKGLSLLELKDEISLIFSLVVYAGKSQSPGGAFQKGINSLEVSKVKFTLSSEGFTFSKLDSALAAIANLKELEKPRLLKALAITIGSDNMVTTEEVELYRAIADSLNCPVPPLINASDVDTGP